MEHAGRPGRACKGPCRGSRIRAYVLVLAALSTSACGQAARSYQGPDPATPGVARIVTIFSEPVGIRFSDPPMVMLHLYDLGVACIDEDTLGESYRGSVSLQDFEKEIVVPGERFLLFRVSMRAMEYATLVTCSFRAGFTPAAGGVYHLDFSAFTTRSCRLHLRDATGRDVPLLWPGPCEDT